MRIDIQTIDIEALPEDVRALAYELRRRGAEHVCDGQHEGKPVSSLDSSPPMCAHCYKVWLAENDERNRITPGGVILPLFGNRAEKAPKPYLLYSWARKG